MCCFSVADVFLDDPPPEKKEEKKEEKQEEKVKKNHVLVSDQLNLQPIVSETRFSVFRSSHPFTPLHFPTQHLTSSTTTLSVNPSCLPKFTSPSEATSSWNRHEPAIYPPSWRKYNTSSATNGHQSLDKPCTDPTVQCVESMDKSSCSNSLNFSPCTLLHGPSFRLPTSLLWHLLHGPSLRLPASLWHCRTPPTAIGAKSLEQPAHSHAFAVIFMQLEQPCGLQSIFRWQCKALPTRGQTPNRYTHVFT